MVRGQLLGPVAEGRTENLSKGEFTMSEGMEGETPQDPEGAGYSSPELRAAAHRAIMANAPKPPPLPPGHEPGRGQGHPT